MDARARLDAPCAPEDLFAWVDDLARYPQWMGLVHRVEQEPVASDGERAWMVELRARVGPLARSKRLRMVRTQLQPHHTVVFERREADGRTHSPWILRVEVRPTTNGAGADGAAPRPHSSLDVHLHYGGRLWTGGLLERALADEIERGRERLYELVSSPTR
jgi:hypothetical protein